jgi:hypothetical protein
MLVGVSPRTERHTVKHGIVKASDLVEDWSATAHLPKPVPLVVADLMARIGYEGTVAFNCHVVSLAIVRSGIYPGARVARGHASGVGISQHSWVVIGNPYDKNAEIIDATLWSYDERVPDLWTGRGRDEVHYPQGAGHFMRGGRPSHHGETTVTLTPAVPLSTLALTWLEMVGPLDYRGWAEVAHLPVEGWPAGEILGAMDDTPVLGALVPIDVLGMTTDRNPGGLYLP